GPAWRRARRVHPQQIPPAGEIRRRVALDQIAAVLVDEGFEGHQVETAVGRYQQAGHAVERRADRLHDALVHGTRPRLHVERGRIAHRLAPPDNQAIDVLAGPEVDADGSAVLRDQIDAVVRRTVGFLIAFRLGIEGTENREFEQRGVAGDRRLHVLERDGPDLRTELGAAVAERRLELFPA